MFGRAGPLVVVRTKDLDVREDLGLDGPVRDVVDDRGLLGGRQPDGRAGGADLGVVDLEGLGRRLGGHARRDEDRGQAARPLLQMPVTPKDVS